VAPPDIPEQLKALDSTLSSVESVIDLDKLRAEHADLEQQAAAPDLWDDQARAQKVTSRMSVVASEINRLEQVRRRLDDLGVLFEMAAEAEDAETQAEAEIELAGLTREIGELEVRTLLNGPYDDRDALITIRAEAGGSTRGLRRDADADVSALGRAPRLRHRGLRHLLCRGGRHQVGHVRGARSACLRHVVGRTGHPPPGAHLPVRQPGADRPRSPRSRSSR